MNRLNIIIEKMPIHKLKIIGLIMIFLSYCISCELFTKEETLKDAKKDTDLSITQYIESHPERFSILSEILVSTGLNHMFRMNGDYTFLAPTNSAFETYFEESGESSISDFQENELIKLVKYHVFDTRIHSGSFVSGIIEKKTLSSEYMVASHTSDGADILFNKTSRIILKNKVLLNGILHEIDKVLIKPESSIYDWLNENLTDYGIFLEAVEKTGLALLISNNTNSDVFYSCFITPDSKYAENSINSFTDLAQMISPDNSSYSDPDNMLWHYIGSHFISNVISMADATESHEFFGSIGGATIKFGFKPGTAEAVLNYNTSEFPSGLDIDEFKSNNLVSNGIIHVMDTMFQVTDSFIRNNLSYIYLDVPGFPYDSLYQAQNQAAIDGTWEEAMQYWPRIGDAIHLPFERTNGWLSLNAPYSGDIKVNLYRRSDWNEPQPELYDLDWPLFFFFSGCNDLLDVTRKLPYIIPGKYRLTHVVKIGQNRPMVQHYFDDKPIGGIVSLEADRNYFTGVDLGVVEIKERELEHFFRVNMVTTGQGYFVAIKLEPAN